MKKKQNMSELAKLSHQKSPRPKEFYVKIVKDRHLKRLQDWINEYDGTPEQKKDEVKRCKQWLRKFKLLDKPNLHSYQGKHIVERLGKGYIASESFAQAVLDLGIPYKLSTQMGRILGINIGIDFENRHKYRNDNPKTFNEWLYWQQKRDDSIGDFASDTFRADNILLEVNLPNTELGYKRFMDRYYPNACDGAKLAVSKAWNEYREFVKGEYKLKIIKNKGERYVE